MSKTYKIAFKHKDESGKEIELAVNAPTIEQKREGKKVWNTVFKDAVDSKSFLRQEIETEIRQRNIWGEDKEKQLKELNDKIQSDLLKCDVKRGGVKLSEAKEAAVRIRVNRFLINNLLQDIHNLTSKSAEAQADDAEFDYLVSTCTVYNTNGKPFYLNVEDYTDKKEEVVSYKAANNLAKILNNYDVDFEKKLPENEFLYKYGFVNEELKFVDKEGNLVDTAGRKINENGLLINDEGQPIDEKGNRINDDGTPIIEFQPFLDDDGEPVELK